MMSLRCRLCTLCWCCLEVCVLFVMVRKMIFKKYLISNKQQILISWHLESSIFLPELCFHLRCGVLWENVTPSKESKPIQCSLFRCSFLVRKDWEHICFNKLPLLHLGPLSSTIKSKRHQIKSDPTPFGYEGITSLCMWNVMCVIHLRWNDLSLSVNVWHAVKCAWFYGQRGCCCELIFYFILFLP